jgi:hypothetical protein
MDTKNFTIQSESGQELTSTSGTWPTALKCAAFHADNLEEEVLLIWGIYPNKRATYVQPQSRVAVWVSSDQQASLQLTGKEHATLPDDELLIEASNEAKRLDLIGGNIEIMVIRHRW